MHKGIVFFPPGTDPAIRRRRWLFLTVWAAVSAMIVWPVYPWVSALPGLFFGLPASMAWVVLALAIQFVALLWLYRTDTHKRSDTPADGNAGSP
jgi:hypothetical protein